MKWFIVLAFYYSCYSPNELEVIYEGPNNLLSYSYGNPCGIEYHEPELGDEDYIEEEPAMEEPDVFIPWKLW